MTGIANRSRLTILAAYGLFWLAALSFSAASQQEQAKIIKLDLNGRRGVVLFNHKAHEAIINPNRDDPHKAKPGAACSGCHHTTSARRIPQLWKCSACHRAEGDAKNPKNREFDDLDSERAFHDKCIGCHRASNEMAGSSKSPMTCSGCHKSIL